MKKYVVFDFDGTIAKTLDVIIIVLNNMATDLSIRQIEKEDIEIFRDNGWKIALKRFKISPFKIPKLISSGQKSMTKYMSNAEIDVSLKQILERLRKQGLVLGILTSNSKENVEIFLEKNDLKMFEFIYADKSLFGKDRVMKKMIKEKCMNVEEVVYIGDEARDWEACQKVGLDMIGVAWGFNSEKLLRNSGLKNVIKEPSELFEKVWD